MTAEILFFEDFLRHKIQTTKKKAREVILSEKELRGLSHSLIALHYSDAVREDIRITELINELFYKEKGNEGGDESDFCFDSFNSGTISFLKSTGRV